MLWFKGPALTVLLVVYDGVFEPPWEKKLRFFLFKWKYFGRSYYLQETIPISKLKVAILHEKKSRNVNKIRHS